MPVLDQFDIKAAVDEILNRWPAVGLAVGVVSNGSLDFFWGVGESVGQRNGSGTGLGRRHPALDRRHGLDFRCRAARDRPATGADAVRQAAVWGCRLMVAPFLSR